MPKKHPRWVCVAVNLLLLQFTSDAHNVRKWYLARISQQTNGLDYGLYSYTEDGDGVDLYVIDAGVRGASRPVNATGANLHPELYHPDHIADLNGATEQANYRVYEVPGFNSGYTVNGRGRF